MARQIKRKKTAKKFVFKKNIVFLQPDFEAKWKRIMNS